MKHKMHCNMQSTIDQWRKELMHCWITEWRINMEKISANEVLILKSHKKKQTWVLVSLPPRNNTPVFRQLGGGFFSIIFQVSLHTNWLLSCINTFKGIELYTRSTMRHTQLFLRANHRFHRLYTTQFYKKSTSVGWRGSWFRCKGRWWPKDWYCQYVTLFLRLLGLVSLCFSSCTSYQFIAKARKDTTCDSMFTSKASTWFNFLWRHKFNHQHCSLTLTPTKPEKSGFQNVLGSQVVIPKLLNYACQYYRESHMLCLPPTQ